MGVWYCLTSFRGPESFWPDVSPALAVRLTRSSTLDILTPPDPQFHPLLSSSLIGVPIPPKSSKTPIEPQFPRSPLLDGGNGGCLGP